MIRAQMADGTVLEFPDGTPDAVVDKAAKDYLAGSGAPAAQAEAAPEPSGPGVHPMAAFGEGATRGLKEGLLGLPKAMLWDLPKTVLSGVTRAARAGANPVSLGMEFGPDAVAAAEGVGQFGKNISGVEGPEAMGEAVGGLLPGLIPVGGPIAKVAKWATKGRAENVIRALGVGDPGLKKKVERMVNEEGFELPIGRAKGIQDEIKARQSVAVDELQSAKDDLIGLPKVSLKKVIDDVEGQRTTVKGDPVTTTVQPKTPAGLTSKKPAPVTVTEIAEESGNPELVNAIDKQFESVMKIADAEKAMKPADIQAFKEQFQAAAKNAYKVAAGTGAATPPSGAAAKLIAKALQDTMENNPGIPPMVRARLAKANTESSHLSTAANALEKKRVANLGTNVLSRSVAALTGRALSGGGKGPAGAVLGVEASTALQAPLFNSLSANAKLQVQRILATEGPEAAMQAAFAAHIAENAARRQNEPGN